MIKVGINGFGRIGRIAFRIGVLKHANEIEFAAINTSGSMNAAGWAHLVNYDTMYRKFEKTVGFEEVKDASAMVEAGESGKEVDPLIGYLIIESKKYPLLAQRDPAKIPWSKYGVNVVIESTGKFTSEEDAKKHGVGGAKRVVISAPVKGGKVGTYLFGDNKFATKNS